MKRARQCAVGWEPTQSALPLSSTCASPVPASASRTLDTTTPPLSDGGPLHGRQFVAVRAVRLVGTALLAAPAGPHVEPVLRAQPLRHRVPRIGAQHEGTASVLEQRALLGREQVVLGLIERRRVAAGPDDNGGPLLDTRGARAEVDGLGRVVAAAGVLRAAVEASLEERRRRAAAYAATGRRAVLECVEKQATVLAELQALGVVPAAFSQTLSVWGARETRPGEGVWVAATGPGASP